MIRRPTSTEQPTHIYTIGFISYQCPVSKSFMVSPPHTLLNSFNPAALLAPLDHVVSHSLLCNSPKQYP